MLKVLFVTFLSVEKGKKIRAEGIKGSRWGLISQIEGQASKSKT